jgi:membrane protein DedA with SNARE-associated domain
MSFDLTTASVQVVDFIREHRAWMAPIVFILAFGESLAFLSLILPFWGMLVALGALVGGGYSSEFWTLLVAAAIGAALGDWLSYWLGYHYQAQIAGLWPLRNHPDLLPRGKLFFEKWGPWAIVFGRFSGPLRASVPLVAGAVRMPNWQFQAANWPSAFLWAAVLLVFGDHLGSGIQAMARTFGVGG